MAGIARQSDPPGQYRGERCRMDPFPRCTHRPTKRVINLAERLTTLCPVPLENPCMQTGLCRMRTESLAAPSPRSGKLFELVKDYRSRA
jgi:hypothetical protein